MGKIVGALRWMPSYCWARARSFAEGETVARDGRRHVYFSICDHFEPYWASADSTVARRRLATWLEEYPKVADAHRDGVGRALPYGFFYPEEEYRREDLALLAELCAAGYGEVEIHLHHDGDSPEGLRRTLLDFKRRLREHHGFLGTDAATGEVVYGFIHGNWALDNSRPDGRWCGVCGELEILAETGCYADFTMPSAPSDTQTRKVNSVYYAKGSPLRSKAHDTGRDARVGRIGEGLLLIQGPLCPVRRKGRFLPRIENAALQFGVPITPERVASWIDVGIGVRGAPGHRFVKLHTHGAQEAVMDSFFRRGELAALLEMARDVCEERGDLAHFVSAREMADAVRALERGEMPGALSSLLPPPLISGKAPLAARESEGL